MRYWSIFALITAATVIAEGHTSAKAEVVSVNATALTQGLARTLAESQARERCTVLRLTVHKVELQCWQDGNQWTCTALLACAKD
jgi:hypothetical protein